MFEFLYLLLIVNVAASKESFQLNYTPDKILCRSCGSPILDSNKIISRLSALSVYTFNDTLFNKREVVVQVLPKDIFFEIPVITSSHSTCLAPGEWEEDELWFPDYSWKPCFCSECGALVGWMFESLNTIKKSDQFFGLILTNIISEQCKHSKLLNGNMFVIVCALFSDQDIYDNYLIELDIALWIFIYLFLQTYAIFTR